jgi:hypothetical protein
VSCEGGGEFAYEINTRRIVEEVSGMVNMHNGLAVYTSLLHIYPPFESTYLGETNQERLPSRCLCWPP